MGMWGCLGKMSSGIGQLQHKLNLQIYGQRGWGTLLCLTWIKSSSDVKQPSLSVSYVFFPFIIVFTIFSRFLLYPILLGCIWNAWEISCLVLFYRQGNYSCDVRICSRCFCWILCSSSVQLRKVSHVSGVTKEVLVRLFTSKYFWWLHAYIALSHG